MSDLTKEEFCAQFIAHMVKLTSPDAADYARQAAPTYWDEPGQREEGPEACAETDISYWEEEG